MAEGFGRGLELFAGRLRNRVVDGRGDWSARAVGGGNREMNVSVNLVKALEFAKEVGAKICGVVGRDGGFTAEVADACAIVPTISAHTVTPLAESFQAIIWHLVVSHPDVQVGETKW